MANEFLLGDDFITNDVTQINQDKSVEGVKNYNAGRVKIKCFLNRYCPVHKGMHANYGLVFYQNTVKSIPENILKNFDFVPGLEGLFLRPKSTYRSTFLAFPLALGITKEDIIVTETGTDEKGNPVISQEGLERLEMWMDNIFGEDIEDIKDLKYLKYQTWISVPSPVDNKKVPTPENYVCNTSPCPTNESLARWKYITLPREKL